MSDDPEPTQPVGLDPTAEVTLPAPPPEADDDRPPWTPSQLAGRFKALDRSGRGGKLVPAAQVETLVDDAGYSIGWWKAEHDGLADKYGRLHRDYKKLRRIEWELREHIKRLEHPEDYSATPKAAVARVAGGRSHGEQIVSRAEEHANRIIANAEEEARQIRAGAIVAAAGKALATTDRPAGDGPWTKNALAEVRWVKAELPPARERLRALNLEVAGTETYVAELERLEAEHAEVLSLLQQEMRDVIDVTESAPQEVAS